MTLAPTVWISKILSVNWGYNAEFIGYHEEREMHKLQPLYSAGHIVVVFFA